MRTDADTMPAYEIIKRNADKFRHFHTVQSVWAGWNECHRSIWKEVAYSKVPRAYFFSDDVICTPDFFEWHDAVQADGDWFASTAWRPPTGNTKPFDLEAYYQISFPNEISMGLCIKRENIPALLTSAPNWSEPQADWKIVMPYVPRCYHIGGFSSHLESVGENTGPAVDVLPNPIPDYGRQKVILKP